MDVSKIKEQGDIIDLISKTCNEQDVLSISRELGIDPKDFYATGITIVTLANNFVVRVYQLGKETELIEYLGIKKKTFFSNIKISNKSAERFSLLFNSFLDGLADIDEADFPESDLFSPIEFEDKMRNKAKLSEDIIKQGVIMKSDITVLRRKANALDYVKYKKLIQKLAKHYLYKICDEYPRDKYDANQRLIALRKSLLQMVPEDLYDRDDEVEEYVDCIIFDTISKCLIFND